MVRHRHGFRRILLCLLGLAALAGFSQASAQTQPGTPAGTVRLLSLSTAAFPRLNAYLEVYDSNGAFVHGLQAGQVSILEDERLLPLSQIEEQNAGVQFVIAITLGPAYTIRDAQGINRLDYLLQGLLSWDPGPAASGGDDFSLLTSDGLEILHTSRPQEILDALRTYQPEARNAIPNLEVLSRAIDIAGEETPRPGMGRAVLFITPPQVADISAGLQSLAGIANQEGIHLSTWLVTSYEYFIQPGAEQFSQAAALTNGRYFAYSGLEPVPNLEDTLQPLRSVYAIAYDSQVNASGSHQVIAQVDPQALAGADSTGGEATTEPLLASAPLSFDISLQTPQPYFLNYPDTITRVISETQSTEPELEANIEPQPTEQTLNISIDFPDGFPRALARTALYVDGALVAENLTAPFDTFTWDLRSYTVSKTHKLTAEATDTLGLSGQSEEISILIKVPRTSQNILAALNRQRGLMIGLLVLIAGAVLALVLVLGGRIRPQLPGQGQRPPKLRSASPAAAEMTASSSDPLTQAVEIPAPSGEGRQQERSGGWASRLHLPQRQSAAAPVKALAYLTPLVESASAHLLAPIPLDADELTLGSDAALVGLMLEHPSVEKLHARLRRVEGIFRLSDCGSSAGTWVNYNLAAEAGTPLEHGDLIHIGGLGFRFTLREPGHLRKPVVVVEERKP